MNRTICIIMFACLAIACVPSDGGSPQPPGQTTSPANAWKPEKKSAGTSTVVLASPALAPPATATSAMQPSGAIVSRATTEGEVEVGGYQAGQGMDLQGSWPSGVGMQAMVEGFLDTGFMKTLKPVGFGDMAYSDLFLDFSMDTQSRIDQINGVLGDLYDRYFFGIPVVQRGVDAIKGSRQVNWEDAIVQRDARRWSIRPVSLRGAEPFEVVLEGCIEFHEGGTITRITKAGETFTCLKFRVGTGVKEELLLSWTVSQYQRGPVQEIQFVGEDQPLVPVFLLWEHGSIAGYLVSLPEGRAEYVLRLHWVPTGKIETDRYNFLVLLTQRHGTHLRIPDAIGAVDPVWLALQMYDYVVTP